MDDFGGPIWEGEIRKLNPSYYYLSFISEKIILYWDFTFLSQIDA